MSAPSEAAVDPIATEIVRQGLNAAAEQMKRALVRTAFSPVIYEVLDFAAALYDRDVAMLAQAPSLPTFMGTMSFCVRSAVDAVGGEDALEPGDIVLYNVPYGTGSHPQDVAMVMPVFAAGELVGYSAIKAHWLDIGGKDPYSTDTVDVFQEGRSSRASSLLRGPAGRGHLPLRDRQLARAEDGGRRHQRDGRRRAHRRSRTDAARRAARPRALPRERRAHLRPRRGRRAPLVRAAARWPLRRPRRDGLQRRGRRARAVRGRGRDRRLAGAPRLHGRPTTAGRPDQLSAAFDGLGEPDRDRHARRRR